MPKKTRKAKIRAARRPVASGYITPSPVQTPAAVQTQTPTAVSTPRTPLNNAASRSIPVVSTDYTYVFRDLRRIALLAIFFFGVMFVLYFLIEVQRIPIFPGLG